MRTSPQRCLLAVAALVWSVGIVLTLVPVERYFRPWEHLRERRVAFRPLARMEMVATGELARNAGLVAFERPRTVTFTTDEHGFRNRPGKGRARIVVVGDSFVVGSGVSDHETLPAALERRLGVPVYNYGCADYTGPLAFLLDRRWRVHPPEVVIWAPAARAIDAIELVPPDRGVDADADASHAREWRLVDSLPSAWRETCATLDAWQERRRENGFRRFAHRLYHGAYFEVVGKPEYETMLVFEGEPRLALTLERQRLTLNAEAREIDRVVETIDQFRRNVESLGAQFIFAPLPGTGLVYPDCFPESEQARIAASPLLPALYERLRQREIAWVDIPGALRRVRSPYLYFDDDTHLNPVGLERAARVLAPLAGEVLTAE